MAAAVASIHPPGVRTNRWPGLCMRCTIDLEPGEGVVYYNPLRVVCPACLLREDVRDDNGFLERIQFPAEIDGRKLDLLDFQKADGRRISTTRALLVGSACGTGKTPLSAMAALRADCGNVIFCPASVRENWVAEIKKWRPDLAAASALSQSDFNHSVREVIRTRGRVIVGSFGVLPGAPCAGCVSLKARLKALKKWKTIVCMACDRLDRPPTAKSDNGKKCLQCQGDTLALPAPRYHSNWYPQCNHYPDLNGAATQHPPYVDVTLEGMRLRLPYHPAGPDVDDWLRGAVRLPPRGRVPDFEKLAPDNHHIHCFGCEQVNPLPDVGTKIVLLADECHAFKNPKNIRTKCWRQFRQRVWDAGGNVFGLSGTPCEGKPMEFWEVLTSLGLEKAAFMHWDNFKRIFNHWFENPRGERMPPQGALRDELHNRLRRVQINRTRKEVLSQLPPRQELRIPVEINQKTISEVNEAVHRMLAIKRAYEDVQAGTVIHQGTRLLDPFDPHTDPEERGRRRGIYENRVAYYFKERPWNEDEEIQEAVEQALTSKGQMPTIDQLSRIRSMLAQAKISAVQQWISDREQEEEPVIVFSQHVSILKKIANSRPGWACFWGGLTAVKRAEMVADFQSGKIKNGLCISIGAGGEGITLTRAAVCAFVDLSFNPAKNHQAESRLIRIGAEQHDRAAAEKAIAELGCTVCSVSEEGNAVPCLEHKTSILVVRFVAKHVVDRLVLDVLEEKERLLEALDWEELECE